MTVTIRLISVLIVGISMLSSNLNAQSAWLPPTNGHSISLEAYRLDIASHSTTFGGSATFLTTRFQARPNLTIVLELPFVRSDGHPNSSFGRPDADTSINGIIRGGTVFKVARTPQTAIGNPYLGLNFKGRHSSYTSFDIGVRFPLTPDSNRFALSRGRMIDFDRWEAFARDIYLLRAQVGHHWSNPSYPVSDWIKGGVTIVGSTEENNFGLIVDYQAGLKYKHGHFTFGTVFLGRTMLENIDTAQEIPTNRNSFNLDEPSFIETVVADESFSFSERSEFLLGIDAGLTVGSIRPGLNARFPILHNGQFDLVSSVRGIYGLNITYLFGGNE